MSNLIVSYTDTQVNCPICSQTAEENNYCEHFVAVMKTDGWASMESLATHVVASESRFWYFSGRSDDLLTEDALCEGCDKYGEEVNRAIFKPEFVRGQGEHWFTEEYIDLLYDFFPAGYNKTRFMNHMMKLGGDNPDSVYYIQYTP